MKIRDSSFESRIFYFIHLQHEENYKRKESSSAG